MQEKYCQSCGMPMGETDEHYGTNADGSKSKDYCSYCYQKGKFKYECTMDEMIHVCVPHMLQANPSMTEQQASEMMKAFFPTLKRWQ